MDRKQKRVILIGRSMAGKTTLCQYINNEDLKYHKTQTIQVVNGTMIDTPGEYLERTYLRGALTVTATDADLLFWFSRRMRKAPCFLPDIPAPLRNPVSEL